MKIKTQKQIDDFCKKYDIPEWRLQKAIFELGTLESDILDNFFKQNSIDERLIELLGRAEEISIYLQQSRTITPIEWEPINKRVAHMKSDIKNMTIEFAHIKPNIIGEIKNLIRSKGEFLRSGQLSTLDFLISIENILSSYK